MRAVAAATPLQLLLAVDPTVVLADRDYDGSTQTQAAGYNLDLNRMSPYQYAPEGVQSGAGPMPGFLPQVPQHTPRPPASL